MSSLPWSTIIELYGKRAQCFASLHIVFINTSYIIVFHNNISYATTPTPIHPENCPHFTIRRSTYQNSTSNITTTNNNNADVNNAGRSHLAKCHPRRVTSRECEDASRKYGRVPKDRECPKRMVALTSHELCEFTDDSIRTTSVSRLKLKCDLSVCVNGTVRIGVVQQNFGLLLDQALWYVCM